MSYVEIVILFENIMIYSLLSSLLFIVGVNFEDDKLVIIAEKLAEKLAAKLSGIVFIITLIVYLYLIYYAVKNNISLEVKKDDPLWRPSELSRIVEPFAMWLITSLFYIYIANVIIRIKEEIKHRI